MADPGNVDVAHQCVIVVRRVSLLYARFVARVSIVIISLPILIRPTTTRPNNLLVIGFAIRVVISVDNALVLTTFAINDIRAIINISINITRL